MSVWAEAETFGGDKSYESPVFTYDGAATISLNPDCAEGAAITLRVARDVRDAAAIDLTLDEARDVSSWLLRAVAAIEELEAEVDEI